MVSPKSGEVRVGTGHGFQLIVAPTEVAAGAQVMVSPSGGALISYSHTCVVRAPAAAITIIESRPPCASMPEPSHFGFARSNEEGIGIVDDAFGFTPKVDAPEDPEKTEAPQPVSIKKKWPEPPVHEEHSQDQSGLLIIGGVVVGAGVLAAVILANQGHDGPASP